MLCYPESLALGHQPKCSPLPIPQASPVNFPQLHLQWWNPSQMYPSHPSQHWSPVQLCGTSHHCSGSPYWVPSSPANLAPGGIQKEQRGGEGLSLV
jgi:hypothetical protein